MKCSLLFALLLFALVPRTVAATLQEVREVHFQMGTYLEVTLWHAQPQIAHQLIREAVKEVHRLDGILSNYDPDSAISRLNRHAGLGSMAVPHEMFELMTTSHELAIKTDGAFDVTIGPLMDMWRNASKTNRLPTPDEIARALAYVGYQKLLLQMPDRVALSHIGMAIDFGGVGKGYAVDRLVSFFRGAGVTAALINFGGSSIGAIGAPSGKGYWKIAIRNTEDRLHGAIGLRDQALATSESMGRSWLIDGRKYGHLIDPLKGAAITEARLATVIAPSATLAEALTKPLILRGAGALAMIGKFPGADAIVLPATGTPSLSQNFRQRSSWKEASTQ
jgi:thiamine biosynthesis lipoprotein